VLDVILKYGVGAVVNTKSQTEKNSLLSFAEVPPQFYVKAEATTHIFVFLLKKK